MNSHKPGSAHQMLQARLKRLGGETRAAAPVFARQPSPPVAPASEPEPSKLQTEDGAPIPFEGAARTTDEHVAPVVPSYLQAEPLAENRRAPRKRSSLPAQILYAGSTTGTPCLVLDMSATGAKLRVPAGSGYCHPNNMPSHITLFMKSDWLQVECEIVRRADHEVGVRFCSAMQQVQKPVSKPASRPTLKVGRR